MIESVLDAFAQGGAHFRHQFWSETTPYRISAQRQGKSRYLLPPSSHIHDAVQAGLVERQLTFMDNQARFVTSFQDLGNDLIEGNDLGFNSRRKKSQRQIGRRELSRHRNPLALDFEFRIRPTGNDHRAVALANAASTRQQSVLVLNVGIRVKRNSGHVVKAVALASFSIQGLDVAKRMSVANSGR